MDFIPRQADNTLDKIAFLVGEKIPITSPRWGWLISISLLRTKQAYAVCPFVDQDKVAYLQGGHHRGGWNLEWLYHKGTKHQHQPKHRR